MGGRSGVVACWWESTHRGQLPLAVLAPLALYGGPLSYPGEAQGAVWHVSTRLEPPLSCARQRVSSTAQVCPPPPLTPISSQLQLVTCQQTYGEHGLSAARTLRGGPRPRRRRRLPRPRRALLEPQCVQAPCASSLPCVNSNSTSMSRSAQAESAPATVSAGISPAITGGGGGHVARVKCRLTTLSTVYALREDGEPCTFVVGAHKRDCGDENDHEAAVDRLNLVHSCPEGVRPAYLAEDKAEIETKIAKMEERVREEARRTSAGPGGSTSGPTTRRRPGARWSAAGATRMPNTPDGGSRRLSSLATPGWGSASKPSGDLDERFPGAFHLRNHVSLLLQVRCSDMFSALRRGTD